MATCDTERVIVIGAGIAGLIAARTLARQGIDVLVLEARDRIGGRLWTVEMGGQPVDLGAAWVNGDDGNPISDLADEVGVELLAAEADPTIFDGRHGGWVSEPELDDIAAGTDAFLEDIEEVARHLGPYASLDDAIQAWLNEEGLQGDARDRLEFAIRSPLELDYSGAASRLAAAHIGQDDGFDGGDWAPDGGYVEIFTALAESEGIEVRVSCPVARVEHGPDGVTVHVEGEPIAGAYAVVTAPLGVLKAGSIVFEPPLPEVKRVAIGRLGVGHMEKVCLRFEEHLWEEGEATFYHLGRTPGAWPAIADLSPMLHGASVLVSVAAGDFAEAATDRGDAALVDEVMDTLRRAADAPLPDPVESVVTRWGRDPWALGAYSFLPVGSSPADMRALGAPVGSRLLFAGEATSPRYYGTVHGAAMSGQREAERILAAVS